MTDQQPHTPNISDFREDFVLATVQSRWMSGPEARDYFNRELAAIVAAAEQRGAIKALRSAAQFFSDPGGDRFASWAALQQYFNDRADQMEGQR